jgi:ABC-2 type transport system permease protein
MSVRRLFQVLSQELRFNVRRPLLWMAVVLVLFFAWVANSGGAGFHSGESWVGGQRAWTTSEFAVAQGVSVVLGLFVPFFLAVGAGMSVIRDENSRVTEILRSTPLLPSEYVWGRFLGVFLGLTLIPIAYLAGLVVVNHVVPSAEWAPFRGPFSLVNYLRPAVILALPPALLIGGTSFALGALTRRGLLVFLLPTAFFLGCTLFLWPWSPGWLSPGGNRLLMLLDPAGFRWLDQTYLAVDRGVRFYNLQPITYDPGFLATRFLFALLGLGAVALLPRWVGGRERLEGKRGVELPTPAAPETVDDEPRESSPSHVETFPARGGTWTGFGGALRSELRELFHAPGLYLFSALILFAVLGTNATYVGGLFDAYILRTAGRMAVEQADVLNLFLCLLLLFYAVETLDRDRSTGLAAISYATPVRTGTLLAAKGLGLLAVVAVILGVALLGDVLLLLGQGTVPLRIGSFVQVWTYLVVSTSLVWIAFLMSVMGLTRSRWAVYGVGLGVVAFTVYLGMAHKYTWLTNWWVRGVVEWTDLGFLELNGRGLLLNRLFFLALGVLFSVLAVGWFPRRDPDPVGRAGRLRPGPLLKRGLVLSPLLFLSLVPGTILWTGIHRGFQGELVRKAEKDYWRRNVATWAGVELPSLTEMEVDLTLDPPHRGFTSEGRYLLVNHLDKPVERIPFTSRFGWDPPTWTLQGETSEAEDRAGLWVLHLPEPLLPEDSVWVGFRVSGVLPKGLTRNGDRAEAFILPSSVLVGIGGVAPTLGYSRRIGVDEDNRSDPRDYPADYYLERLEPLFGSAIPATSRIRITGPDYLTYTSVGNLVSEERRDGRVSTVWETGYPVRFTNVVAGRWKVWKGSGTEIYYHPDHGQNIEEIGTVLDAARQWYAEWFAPYPWTVLRVSEVILSATGTPSNITLPEADFLPRNRRQTLQMFFETAHEAAHQWWGNMLTPGAGPGGNTLSEGMANFSALLLFEQVEGEAARREFFERWEAVYFRARRVDDERPMVQTDGSRETDGLIQNVRGGLVPWMLMRLMGRDAMLAGLREFIARFKDGPDYPLLEDQIQVLREFAPDTAAFDAFVRQWYFEIVTPEYRLEGVEKLPVADSGGTLTAWETTFTLRNAGTGRMSVDVAVTSGDPFDEEGNPVQDFREARTTVTLGAGGAQTITLRSDFDPDRIVVDPDVQVFQFHRERAVHKF